MQNGTFRNVLEWKVVASVMADQKIIGRPIKYSQPPMDEWVKFGPHPPPRDQPRSDGKDVMRRRPLHFRFPPPKRERIFWEKGSRNVALTITLRASSLNTEAVLALLA